MVHLDLFSGIGGFAYAVDQVWDEVQHIFCENDKFCQKVLQKHWPDAPIISDVREITPDTASERWDSRVSDRQERSILHNKNGISKKNKQEWGGWIGGALPPTGVDLLTGGFPCQPFSQAGKRGGTADNRYLWPEMLRVIQLTKPTWIIAENVRGLLTINEGMVFEQVCLDLEREGYEVQPLIIPAVAVNAPHRRDRIWFIAHKLDTRLEGSRFKTSGHLGFSGGEWGNQTQDSDAQDSISQRSRRRMESGGQVLGSKSSETQDERPGWEKNWVEVATELCRMDDGISTGLDELGGFTKSQHRVQRLKSLGNAIVPQIAIELMRAIKQSK